ncbi:MAG: hypothetical protein M1816_006435 [Peltula sp. TS41687]|nr:MAG: hypothetical protein M1816_006435 [Peltula sp. TS41687]
MAAAAAEPVILVGSYTSSIYALKLSDSKLSLLSSNPTGSSSPSWISRVSGDTILASFEDADLMQTFLLSRQTGKLVAQSKPVQTVKGPAYSGVTLDGQHAIALGYSNGGYTLASCDGDELRPMRLSYASGDPLASVPEADTTSTHPHMFLQHPALPLIYVVDLARDALHTYELESNTNRLVYQRTLDVPGGPRHVILNKAATRGWVITEMSSVVVPLTIDHAGIVRLDGEPSPLTEQGKVKGAGAAILLTSDEKYIVASNRQVQGNQNDFLTTLEVKADGTLGAAQYTDTMGQRVRGMAFNEDSSLLIVGNQSNDTIAVFSRNAESGKLELMSGLFDIRRAAGEMGPVQPSAFLWMAGA